MSTVLSKLEGGNAPTPSRADITRRIVILAGGAVIASVHYAYTTGALSRILAGGRGDSKKRSKRRRDQSVSAAADKVKKDRAPKAAVDWRFFKSMGFLLRVLVPRLACKETAMLLLVGVSLVLRTHCDIWLISNNTAIENAIVSQSHARFAGFLAQFVSMFPVLALVNNALKYGIDELKLLFRSRLTELLFSKYLGSENVFYRMVNLDNRISNPDQVMTQDVEKFCASVVELYSNLSKPLLDIALYASKLTRNIGWRGPTLMIAYLAMISLVLTRLRRPLAGMTASEQQHEGDFRFINSRLITHSEEVAFYDGAKKEHETVVDVFRSLVAHARRLIHFRMSMGFFDNVLAKYFATVLGFYVVSRPFLAGSRHTNSPYSERLQDYYENGRMLFRLAEACGRVALAGRELTKLAGYTARISHVNTVLDELKRDTYTRTQTVAPRTTVASVVSENGGSDTGYESSPTNFVVDITKRGTVEFVDHVIRFVDVPLVTPNGDVLVPKLNFEVRSGTNVLVCGPNGCGKSSLFRILGGLWPVFAGTLTKPRGGNKALFYIPQKPYMTIGTLRDQLIYPETFDPKMGATALAQQDAKLALLLRKVKLEYLLERHSEPGQPSGGWDAKEDWLDVLSGGEKQRLAMARVFYHRPQFAILDECTSAVSVDVEAEMYSECRKLGITLFTVSHRKSLWVHHEFVLRMSGRGGYEYGPIDKNTVEFGS